jgi:Type VI secretion, TssG
MAGRGWQPFWVVEQSPAPGELLGPDASIVLHIAGLGLFHSLPVGMWDRGGDAELGTKEIVDLFDDPLQKTARWIRAGDKMLDLRPDLVDACSRWISLFGLNPEDWPPQSRYKLAALLPNLHRLAGKKEGIQLTLHLLFGLPIQEISRRPSYSCLEHRDLSLLGCKASRLGVDAVAGGRVEDLECLVLVIGPVPLQSYYQFQEQDHSRLLAAAFDLCLPCYQKHRLSWSVLDPTRAPRLGFENENARLGINSRLGSCINAPAIGTAAECSDVPVCQGQSRYTGRLHEEP